MCWKLIQTSYWRVRNSQNHLLSELMFIFNVLKEFNVLLMFTFNVLRMKYILFCRILQGLNRFLDLIPVNNETGNITFTLNNFGIIALETSSLDQTEPGQAFSADLGPVTNAVSSSEAIVTDQLLVTSKPISNVTGSISLQNLSSCVGSGSQRIAYSVFRTDALFLTPDTACTRFTVGSIILGVRVNDIRGCNTTSVTVDMQQLEQVYI